MTEKIVRAWGFVAHLSQRHMNWPHIHLALNHIPVLGIPFLLVVLWVARWKRNESFVRFALWGFVVLVAFGFVVKFTGDEAFHAIASELWAEESVILRHEQAADQSATVLFVLGIIAAIGLALSRRGRPAPVWSVWATLLLAATATVLIFRAANLGGQIRHTEIRPAASSSSEPARD